jgi:hypothetical protein
MKRKKRKKKREELKELRVLGGKGMARALPPSGKKEWEPGASTGEAEVCKLNPAPLGHRRKLNFLTFREIEL